MTRKITPARAATQTTQSSVVWLDPVSSTTVSGVYVPAMIKKMLAWSKRLSRSLVRGDQLPRWYSAEIPKSSAEVAA